MMTAESPATRMMGIVHATFGRDLARVRLMLTAAPVPQGECRQAVAGRLVEPAGYGGSGCRFPVTAPRSTLNATSSATRRMRYRPTQAQPGCGRAV